MPLRMRSTGLLWDRSKTPPEKIDFIDGQIPLTEEKRSDDGDWIHVAAKFPGEVVKGDVRAADVVEATPKPMELWPFIKYATYIARVTNEAKDKQGISRDYLLALALVLNDVTSLPIADAALTAFDPFKFSEKEWQDFLNQGDNKTRYFPEDRLDPLAQLAAAAASVSAATQALSTGLTNPDASKGSGPYVPSTIDLFLAQMLGAKAAIAVSKKGGDTANKGGETPIETAVTASGGDFAAAKTRYPAFLGVAPPTIANVCSTIEGKFDAAYKLVATLLSENTPEDLPQVAAGGKAPWFAVAKAEFDKGIKEPNPRILDYFKAINFATTTTKTPWCAAFVSFCMKSSGDPTIANSVPTKGPALAATWRNWGSPLPLAGEIPVGAVTVLSPSEPADSSGHVSFFVRAEGDNVVLLGGNQSDSVKESTYKKSKIVALRWMNAGGVPTMVEDGPAAAEGGVGGGSLDDVGDGFDPLTGANWKKFCQVLGTRESGNVYEKVNKIGFCGRWQFGALALIDCGYVKRDRRRNSDLLRSDSWLGTNGVTSREGWLSGRATQNAAMLQYTRMHYKSLIKSGSLSAGSSLPRVAGLLAASHLMGVGGANDFVRGKFKTDGFGTSTKEYYALLSKAFGGTGSLEP